MNTAQQSTVWSLHHLWNEDEIVNLIDLQDETDVKSKDLRVLEEKGLLELATYDGEDYVLLTEKGREKARLLEEEYEASFEEKRDMNLRWKMSDEDEGRHEMTVMGEVFQTLNIGGDRVVLAQKKTGEFWAELGEFHSLDHATDRVVQELGLSRTE